MPADDDYAERLAAGERTAELHAYGHPGAYDRAAGERDALRAEIEAKDGALRNVLLLAMLMSHRGVADAEHLIRYCAEGGVKPSVLRIALEGGDDGA